MNTYLTKTKIYAYSLSHPENVVLSDIVTCINKSTIHHTQIHGCLWQLYDHIISYKIIDIYDLDTILTEPSTSDDYIIGMYAILYNRLDVFDLVVAKLDLNHKYEIHFGLVYYSTLLDVAIYCQNVELFVRLLNYGADPLCNIECSIQMLESNFNEKILDYYIDLQIDPKLFESVLTTCLECGNVGPVQKLINYTVNPGTLYYAQLSKLDVNAFITMEQLNNYADVLSKKYYIMLYIT